MIVLRHFVLNLLNGDYGFGEHPGSCTYRDWRNTMSCCFWKAAYRQSFSSSYFFGSSSAQRPFTWSWTLLKTQWGRAPSIRLTHCILSFVARIQMDCV